MKNNPYIGPRPYSRADRDKFYRRSREACDLRDLLIAERVVRFYAQPRAGKSSLLNAKVIPDLEKRRGTTRCSIAAARCKTPRRLVS